MSKNIVIKIDKDLFISSKAKDRLRRDAKKNTDEIELLDSSKYINEKYKLSFDYSDETNEIQEIVINAASKNLPKTKEEIRQGLKEKLRKKITSKTTRRNNLQKKEVDDMSKKYGSDLTNSYLETRNKMGINIPDPEEIMNNKDEYIKQFSEYSEYIKKIDPKELKKNPYHKYAKQIMKKLGMDKNLPNLNKENTQDLYKNFMDMIKKNNEAKSNANETTDVNDINNIINNQFQELEETNITEEINNDSVNVNQNKNVIDLDKITQDSN